MTRFLRISAAAAIHWGVAAMFAADACAASVSSLFGDNMILQRGASIPVWGLADPGETVTATLGVVQASAQADAQGNWLVTLPPMNANADGQELIISGRNTLTISNVLVGDVWLCAGQSNMGTGFKRREPALDPGETNLPQVRYLNIPNAASVKPLEQAPALKWLVSSPATVPDYAAVPWYFGQMIHQQTGIPIGIIKANWGGAIIENWMSPDSMKEVPELAGLHGNFSHKLKLYEENLPKNTRLLADWLRAAEDAKAKGIDIPSIPAVDLNPIYAPPNGTGFFCMYNGMIHYLTRLPIKGVSWYQGESSADDGPIYQYKMVALINGWRKAWNQPELPFYFVQLPNLGGACGLPEAIPKGWPLFREVQARCLSIPNTGMAVTIDIGDEDLHPRNKFDTGRRLAMIALARNYGVKIDCTAPVFKKHKVTGSRVVLTFEQVGQGLMVATKDGLNPATEDNQGKLQEFAVAGADRQFHAAIAVIEGDTVVVSCEQVPVPVAVRYAFTFNPAKRNLYGRNGLPVAPFRTDRW